RELADAVTALVDKSILIPERSSGVVRYCLLETLRDYGREHLQESGDCQTQQRRHRDWFTQLALKADSDWHSPRQAEWIHCLDREYADLCAAMTFGMSDPSSAPFTLRIANALRRYWISRGLLNEGRHWLRHARACQIERPSRGHVTALSAEGLLAGLQGEITDFVALVAQARDCAARLADPVADRLVSNAEGQLALLSGDETSAAAHFEYTLDTSRRSERLDERFEALLGLVVASGLCGKRERAIECAETVLRTEVLAETTYHARALANIASVVWREEPARASELLNQGLRLSRDLNSPIVALACLDTAACLAGAAYQSHRAVVLLGAARALRRSMGCHGLNTHTEEELGEHRLRLVLGEHAFTKALQHGERLNLEKAVAYALDETTSPKKQALSCPDGGLTVRERQVANLVAHGLTNRAIAEKLVISQRTAQGHVEHVLSKLGYTSRVQIAAWIAEHDDDKH
ncbi:LuxR family transcriptional regulator, partial [Rhodococcus wratislaviensis IFP 2016]